MSRTWEFTCDELIAKQLRYKPLISTNDALYNSFISGEQAFNILTKGYNCEVSIVRDEVIGDNLRFTGVGIWNGLIPRSDIRQMNLALWNLNVKDLDEYKKLMNENVFIPSISKEEITTNYFFNSILFREAYNSNRLTREMLIECFELTNPENAITQTSLQIYGGVKNSYVTTRLMTSWYLFDIKLNMKSKMGRMELINMSVTWKLKQPEYYEYSDIFKQERMITKNADEHLYQSHFRSFVTDEDLLMYCLERLLISWKLYYLSSSSDGFKRLRRLPASFAVGVSRYRYIGFLAGCPPQKWYDNEHNYTYSEIFNLIRRTPSIDALSSIPIVFMTKEVADVNVEYLKLIETYREVGFIETNDVGWITSSEMRVPTNGKVTLSGTPFKDVIGFDGEVPNYNYLVLPENIGSGVKCLNNIGDIGLVSEILFDLVDDIPPNIDYDVRDISFSRSNIIMRNSFKDGRVSAMNNALMNVFNEKITGTMRQDITSYLVSIYLFSDTEVTTTDIFYGERRTLPYNNSTLKEMTLLIDGLDEVSTLLEKEDLESLVNSKIRILITGAINDPWITALNDKSNNWSIVGLGNEAILPSVRTDVNEMTISGSYDLIVSDMDQTNSESEDDVIEIMAEQFKSLLRVSKGMMYVKCNYPSPNVVQSVVELINVSVRSGILSMLKTSLSIAGSTEAYFKYIDIPTAQFISMPDDVQLWNYIFDPQSLLLSDNLPFTHYDNEEFDTMYDDNDNFLYTSKRYFGRQVDLKDIQVGVADALKVCNTVNSCLLSNQYISLTGMTSIYKRGIYSFFDVGTLDVDSYYGSQSNQQIALPKLGLSSSYRIGTYNAIIQHLEDMQVNGFDVQTLNDIGGRAYEGLRLNTVYDFTDYVLHDSLGPEVLPFTISTNTYTKKDDVTPETLFDEPSVILCLFVLQNYQSRFEDDEQSDKLIELLQAIMNNMADNSILYFNIYSNQCVKGVNVDALPNEISLENNDDPLLIKYTLGLYEKVICIDDQNESVFDDLEQILITPINMCGAAVSESKNINTTSVNYLYHLNNAVPLYVYKKNIAMKKSKDNRVIGKVDSSMNRVFDVKLHKQNRESAEIRKAQKDWIENKMKLNKSNVSNNKIILPKNMNGEKRNVKRNKRDVFDYNDVTDTKVRKITRNNVTSNIKRDMRMNIMSKLNLTIMSDYDKIVKKTRDDKTVRMEQMYKNSLHCLTKEENKACKKFIDVLTKSEKRSSTSSHISLTHV